MRNVELGQNKGFTLIELMVTVAIIGILAAIAVPIFSHYVAKSKSSEVAEILQGIRAKQESYYSNKGTRYTDPLDWNPPLVDACECTTTTRFWDMPADGPWVNFGFVPDGPTYYSYRVDTNYRNGMRQNIAPDAAYPAHGTTWKPFTGPWFVAEACGDVDCDKKVAHFYISSQSRNIYHAEAEQEIY